MYLKEIEMSGFKSFADKLNLQLDNRITCVVGPNGSGKSNVVDAVRWVLGEQSVKSLRGEGSMSDVIFSGSKSRNASSVASVSLIFDNQDHYLPLPYTEVNVKRRIYKTGENEYFINGEKCRLKDITDLFMDSGIGKESFNIISQGEVMQILSTSPTDRRVVFEEAACVLKYKKRKEEALRKLDRTHQNMERVEDIIAELKNQISPLEEQSKKAKEYLDAKEKLEKVEVGLLAYEITSIHDESLKMKEKMEKLKKDILSISSDSATKGAKIDSKRLELLKLENLYKEENSHLLDLTKEVERLHGEKKILQERSKYKAEDAKVHDYIVNLKEEKLTLENEIFDLEKSLENDRYLQEEENKKVQDFEEEVHFLNKRREDSLREYSGKNREYLELKNRIQALENNIENGGSLPGSVRAILNNPRITGVYGTFMDLLEVDPKFAKALEVAILSQKYSLVVKDDAVIKTAIEYLKREKLGRATFFPIENMKPKYLDSDTKDLLMGEKGYIDIFKNLVRFAPAYEKVVASQLGNILVAIDLDSANRIAKKIQHRYRIVTLDGEVLNVGGSVSGGSLQTSKSTLFQKQELERLKKTKVEWKETLLEIDKNIKSLEEERSKQEEKLYQEKQILLEKNEEIKNRIITLQNKTNMLEETKKELTSLEHVVDSSLSKEEEKLMDEYSKKVDLKNDALHTLEKISFEKDKLSQEIEEMDAQNKVNNADLRKLEQESKELEIQVGKYDVLLDHHLNVLNEDYSLTYEKAKNNYPLELEVEEAKEKVGTYKDILKRIGMVNLAAIEEYEKVSERYEFLTSQREDLIHAKESLLEIIEEMDEIMKEEFLKTFEEVRKEFQGVFKKLFSGGTADLRLTDKSDLLTTGVEIIASPPGKKLTSINLLSGGEKTLTAISLLFAILNVRTVPFCLFDEVEAALDDANVENFGKYLESYQDKTQFLLITHKKKTMEYAKTLYGITMQESGVSKLVSVQFDKMEKVETL